MKMNLRFDSQFLNSLVGGTSAIDFTRLRVKDLEQAKEFILSYGFDLDDEEDEKKLWVYYRRSVAFLETQLLEEGEQIPVMLSDPSELKDLRYLLIYASTKDTKQDSLQRWSCSILRVVHVLVHLDNDLFTEYFPHIQDQIIKPISDHIASDPILGTKLGGTNYFDEIPLKKFEVKALKDDSSSIIKLLIKPEAVAFSLLDKVGFRFVTKSLFDVFRVMRYLVRNHLVSLPHFIPDQSNNTIFPVNLFLELIESLPDQTELTSEEIDLKLKEKLASEFDRAEYKEKLNEFSGADFKFIKFISRRLVKIDVGEGVKPIHFFFPFEVQIMDYENYLMSISGPAKHDEYKKRQTRQARARVLGLKASSVELGDPE